MKAFAPFASLVMLGLLLSGCSIAGKSSPSKFYVLTAMPTGTEALPEFAGDPPNVGVSQVEIATFLDRPQITYRVGGNEVAFNEFARWAEPVGDGVTRVTRQNLTNLMGSGRVAAFPWMQPFPRQYLFTAVVTDFCTGENGVAELTVIYRIADAKNTNTFLVKEGTYTHSTGEALTNDNAVEALSDTLSQFCLDAARSIADVDREHQVEPIK